MDIESINTLESHITRLSQTEIIAHCTSKLYYWAMSDKGTLTPKVCI